MYKLIKQGSCKTFGKLFDKKLGSKIYDIPAYCLYTEINGRKILIDTGYSSEHFYASTKKFPSRIMRYITPVNKNIINIKERLKNNNINVDNLNILITHLHPDHIGSLKDLNGCSRIYISEREYKFYSNLKRIAQIKNAYLSDLLPENFTYYSIEKSNKTDKYSVYFEEAYDIFGDNSVFAFSMFGHTPYHFAYFIPKYKLLYIGDGVYTKRNLVEDKRLPKVLIKIAWDKDEAHDSFNRLKNFKRDNNDVTIVSTHDIFLGVNK